MINNQIKLAKQKISEHKRLGTSSPFSIFEIAQMMDRIKHYPNVKKSQMSSIFFTEIIYN